MSEREDDDSESPIKPSSENYGNPFETE